MIKWFRAVSSALQDAAKALWAAVDVLGDLHADAQREEGIEARVEALEATQRKWQAEVEAQLTRVESRYKAVRSAEERARAHARQAAESVGFDPEELEDLPPDIAAVYAAHAERERNGGVQPVPEDLEDDGEGEEEADPLASALRTKWGG